MKSVSTVKCINISIIYSQNGNVDFVKALVHKLSYCDDGKVARIFRQRWYKWGYINRFLKSFWLHFARRAKITAYGFDYQSLRIMESFLSNRQQRTNINNSFSR